MDICSSRTFYLFLCVRPYVRAYVRSCVRLCMCVFMLRYKCIEYVNSRRHIRKMYGKAAGGLKKIKVNVFSIVFSPKSITTLSVLSFFCLEFLMN